MSGLVGDSEGKLRFFVCWTHTVSSFNVFYRFFVLGDIFTNSGWQIITFFVREVGYRGD